MSKKYDEYMSQFVNQPNTVSIQDHLDPMFSKLDPALAKEIRDRAMIDLVRTADKVGMDLSYGDIIKIIDHNPSEKEYETLKAELEIK